MVWLSSPTRNPVPDRLGLTGKSLLGECHCAKSQLSYRALPSFSIGFHSTQHIFIEVHLP